MRSLTLTCRTTVFLFLSSFAGLRAMAQKPFTEGVIVYNITMETADHKTYKGQYIYTIKGPDMRKEIRLSNGYQDIVMVNHANGNVYSLQTKNGKKYAIQLSLDDLTKRQVNFAGYTVNNEQDNSKDIAGISATKGSVKYKDGSATDVYYTNDWYPVQGVAFERFPDTKFLPLSFSYKEKNGLVTTFEANRVEPGPVENAVFRIPADYKMISYEEYKELSK